MLDRVQAYNPSSSPVIASIVVLALSALLVDLVQSAMTKRFPVKGKHALVCGGSQGLGLAVAEHLVKRGANVTIVSRSQHKLDAALEQLKALRIDANQRLFAISTDLTSPEATLAAFDEFERVHAGSSGSTEVPDSPVGTSSVAKCPDYVFACTGASEDRLGYFTEMSPDTLRKGFESNYLTALWTSHAAAKKMVQHKVKGKIIFVGSVLSFFGFVGYSGYAPAKSAVRGLADTLRNELLMYGIDVHAFFPGNFYSPGFEEEQKCKPEITKKIEEADEGTTPEKCAESLIRGLEKGHFFITDNPIGHIFRSSTKGASPGQNVVFDLFWKFIGLIGLPIWMRMTDGQVRKFAKARGTLQ